MKTTVLILTMTLLFGSQTGQAQISENANLDSNKIATEAYIGIRYYYFPNLEAYYDTRAGIYILKENGSWTTSETIDPTSRGYCHKNSMYVMIKGYLGDNPTSLLEEHKREFPADFSTKRKPPVAGNYAPKKKQTVIASTTSVAAID